METFFRSVRPNIVQSIRAYRVDQLQSAAEQLAHHFLYANLGKAHTKQEALDLLVAQYRLQGGHIKNFDSVLGAITDTVYRSGPQTGFVVVLEHIPCNPKFDKEVREQLLDAFRDAADYWGERRVPFRCFYSFAVARAPSDDAVSIDSADEPMPTDKLVDVSPMALRMSSPFNAGYWLNAA